MDEIEGRIRSWVDSVASADARRTTADDAIERAERTARRSGTPPRMLVAALVAAAVLVVVGGLVVRGPWTSGDGSLNVATAPPATVPGSSTSNGDPRLLGVVEGDRTGLMPFLATSEAELAEMWTSSGLAGDPPGVDFDRHVVMALMTPRNMCEAEASGPVEGPAWRSADPSLCAVDPEGPMGPVGRTTTFLVVVERA